MPGSEGSQTFLGHGVLYILFSGLENIDGKKLQKTTPNTDGLKQMGKNVNEMGIQNIVPMGN